MMGGYITLTDVKIACLMLVDWWKRTNFNTGCSLAPGYVEGWVK